MNISKWITKKLLCLFCLFSLTPNPLFSYFNRADIETAVQRFNAVQDYNKSYWNSRVDKHKALIAAYFIQPGDLVFDLGAHLGEYTRYYQGLVGENGCVVAYEASPPIYAKLTEMITTENAILKNKAISNISGGKALMKIYPNDSSPQSCTLNPFLWHEERMPGNTTVIEVETEKLDDWLFSESNRPLRFIKIDVEGYEHTVFEGATQILKLIRPFIIFEYGCVKEYLGGTWNPGTIQQLEELGYVCYDCETDYRVYPNFEVWGTDLLAIPLEYEQEVAAILPLLHLDN